MKRNSHFLRLTLSAALLTGTLLQTAFSYADDTEIFFGGALAEEGIKPNVLFLLDDSSSMNCTPESTNSACTARNNSRLEIMKDSFEQIVNSATGINLGVMAFNTTMNAPVDFIDKIMADTTVLESTQTRAVTASADDASQSDTGSNNIINQQTLVIGGSAERITGLRFVDLPIPKNSRILEARLGFTASSNGSGAVTLKVLPETSGDVPTFATAEKLSSRSVRTQNADNVDFLTWEPGAWIQNEPVPYEEGPDVTAQLQAIVNSDGWCGNNAAALQIRTVEGTGTREFHSFDSSPDWAPALMVRWEASGVTGCHNPIVEYSVPANNADGIQISSGSSGSNRAPNLTGTTLQFGNGRNIAARFTGINIPQGSNILSAQLISTSAAATGTATTTSANTSLENSVSPAALGTGNNNFSGRTILSSTSCSFTQATTQQTNSCNLTAQVQALVNKTNWSATNSSMVALIRPTSTGPSLIARDSNVGKEMKLRIKYQGTAPKTYGETLISEVGKLSAPGGSPYHYTPIVPTLYSAAQYLRDQSRSPITSACQPTHIVLLSDGAPTVNDRTSSNSLSGINGPSCNTSTASDERCGREIAKHLAENDQASWIEDASNYVTTHSIGFALNSGSMNRENCTGGNAAARFLCDIAKNGGGGYYSADNASELTNAFNEIIRSVISTDASFVSASAPVNSFNRLDNRDELYFAVFRPQETDRWPGNLKRYKVDVDGVRILDAAGNEAVDANTGFFSTTSRSFWSTEVDGNLTSLGGAASKLPAPASRNLYTFTGTDPNNASLTKVTTTTNLNTLLGAANDAEREQLINYLLGWEGGVANSTQRKAMGDPLHSSPRLVTYKANDSAVVLGTNEGMVHVINTSDGVEHLAFMPKALLGNAKELMGNGPSSVDNRRPYGMDNTVTLWTNDANGNGSILNDNGTAETGEFVYAYATMGRGGRNLYALDLTNRSAPKLLWEIIGGTTTGFEKLGQTWSTPVRTKIQIGPVTAQNPPTDVLIFAGGYDEGQDAQVEGDTSYTRREDNVGNALYIVNAKTGALIWSISVGDDEAMKYSMPSPVRVIDLQTNQAGQLVYDSAGTADQIFVGDMGGQIWRFIIHNGNTADQLVTGGVMADLGGDGVNARRFYHAPDVALTRVGGALKLAVNIGSGYRGHPLHKVIQDRFYSLQTSSLTTSATAVIDEDDLADVTSVFTESGTTTALTGKQGWMITLGDDGEKVLSAALTVNNVIYFNTYEPTARQGSCQANVGLNRAYSVKLGDGRPVRNSGDIDASDRYVNVNTSGLLPDPVVVTIGGKNVLVRFPSIEKIDDEPEASNYWIDIYD